MAYVFRCNDLEAIFNQWLPIVQEHSPDGEGYFDEYDLMPFAAIQELGRIRWFYYTDNAEGIAIRLYDRPFKDAHLDCFQDKYGDPWVILRGHRLGPDSGQCKIQLRTVLGKEMWNATAVPTGATLQQRISILNGGEVRRLKYFEDAHHNHAQVIDPPPHAALPM